jgi:hypothetical protein
MYNLYNEFGIRPTYSWLAYNSLNPCLPLHFENSNLKTIYVAWFRSGDLSIFMSALDQVIAFLPLFL